MFWKSSGSKNLWFQAIENWRFWKSSESKNLQFQVCDENFRKRTKPLILGFSENFQSTQWVSWKNWQRTCSSGQGLWQVLWFLEDQGCGLCPVLWYFENHWSRVQIPDPYPLDLSLKKRELPNTGTYYIQEKRHMELWRHVQKVCTMAHFHHDMAGCNQGFVVKRSLTTLPVKVTYLNPGTQQQTSPKQNSHTFLI